MKTTAFNTKIIYNHLLAVALAGIISLLFVHGVCQFLHTSSKRIDYSVLSTVVAGTDNKGCHLQTGEPSESGSEGFVIIQDLLGFTFQPHRFSRPFIISTFDSQTNIKKAGYSITIYRNCLPPMWGPSIPIVHRRLII